ncbi:lysoplasmalogenase [Paenibacillus sp. PAMC21692]|uniref:lysoplasmalogenase n=1 Tax=Paenibacillus sp. PAMC21692 TaxID=2762320 RepID=UPI00164D7119|nr:lysoplasmalogenase [Paenibacillus sp. PAMC21692]QNK57742.1 lysoplasmalogenase [Paenibacillus sp. PAMC21692]
MDKKRLITLIVLTAMVHLATLSVDQQWLHWLFKLLPMALIIVLAAVSSGDGRNGSAYRKLVLAGLVFSIGGDTFLLLPNDPWFVYGLGSFLVGHLFYVAAMMTRWRGRSELQNKEGKRHGMAIGFTSGILIVGYSLVLGSRFYDSMMTDDSQKGLWIPVVVYIVVIGAMGWSAIMSRSMLAAGGALLFIASDSLLAWNKFVGELPFAGVLIMATYFAAQLLIASSIERGGQRRMLQQDASAASHNG